VIAIETSTRPGSVAVSLEGRRVSRVLDVGSSHARDLLPAIAELVRDVAEAPSVRDALTRIEYVFVGVGPGSYTGLRVGIATALGIAYASGAKLRGIPSFEALAFSQLDVNQEGFIAWNARGQRFYAAKYARTDADVVPLVEPCLVRAEELRTLLRDEELVIVDETVVDAAELDQETRERLRTEALPEAEALLKLGPLRVEALGTHQPEEVEPLYLREFGE